MSATAIWHVHCHSCADWWDTLAMDTKAKCEADARRHGWKVTRTENICPDCLRDIEVARAALDGTP